jgi:rod shape-determining protein MreC
VRGLRNWPLLLVLLLASVVILVLGWTGTLRPLENAASSVVVPVQYTVQRLVQGVVDLVRAPADLKSLRTENERLQAQVSELAYQLSLQREVQIENENLRGLLNLKNQSPEILGPGADLLFADVIGSDPSNLLHYLTIDRGNQDGVQVGMPVITAPGLLVGQISEVGPNSSRVTLLTDPSSKVNALVQSSRATGVVEGDERGTGLVMRYLPQTDAIVQQGDLVLTSGLGGRLPRRLLIGEVISVQKRDVDMFQEARLRPAASFDRLESVMVVRSFTPIGSDAPAAQSASPASAGG